MTKCKKPKSTTPPVVKPLSGDPVSPPTGPKN
jgi:hypothetical protein